MFARIRTVFAWIRTDFAHLIIGCAIRYPKIGNLRYQTIQHPIPLYHSIIGLYLRWLSNEYLESGDQDGRNHATIISEAEHLEKFVTM